MGESSIAIVNQAGGAPVATRSSVQIDDSANLRVVQIVDHATRAIEFQSPKDATMTLDGANISERFMMRRQLTGGDNDTQISNIIPSTDGTPFGKAMMRVGDATHVAVYGRVVPSGVAATNAKIIITPLVMAYVITGAFGPEYSPACALPSFVLSPVCPLGTAVDNLDFIQTMDESSNYEQLSYLYTIPTHGAEYLAFHVHVIGSLTRLRLFAQQTSMAGRNMPLDQQVANGDWGGLSYLGFEST